ncbi:carboxypeptidase-like regulatory domain-containing protein [Hymenobacter daeguensis]
MGSHLISIPQPCAESWDAMTPTSTGRHCAACQKTVVDFTLKTDAEILAYLAKAAAASTCGRFAAAQLDRPLQPAISPAPPARWRTWLAAVAAVWSVREAAGISTKAQAPMEMQRRADKAVPEQLRATRRPDYEGAGGTTMVRGVVLDSASHEALPGALVRLKDSAVEYSTDAEGAFMLTLPAGYAPNGVATLQISFLGYVTEERQFVIGEPGKPVLLQTDAKGFAEVTVTAGLIIQRPKPKPWHPRGLYHWTRYQLTRPFRR